MEEGPGAGALDDAFAVVNLLEGHFGDLVDYEFTARMEDDLDEIAEGHEERVPWLGRFWFGNGTDRGSSRCARGRWTRPTPRPSTPIPLGVDADGEPVVVRNGSTAPTSSGATTRPRSPTTLPSTSSPSSEPSSCSRRRRATEPIGDDPSTGLPVYAKNGRFGPYVQLGDADTLPDGREAQDGVAVQRP